MHSAWYVNNAKFSLLMGGHIKVKSKPNEGTAFTVELPFEQSNVDVAPLREYVLEIAESAGS